MRYIRIALYDLEPGTYADVVVKANAGLLPLFQASPGFQSFGVSEVDKDSFVSVSRTSRNHARRAPSGAWRSSTLHAPRLRLVRAPEARREV